MTIVIFDLYTGVNFVDCATKEKVISTILRPTIYFWLTGVPGGRQW